MVHVIFRYESHVSSEITYTVYAVRLICSRYDLDFQLAADI